MVRGGGGQPGGTGREEKIYMEVEEYDGISEG